MASSFKKITESDSNYRYLEKMTVKKLLTHINQEDEGVAAAVKKTIPAIEKLVKMIINKMKAGGRLFYIGAGTSGRLGILDASECPPTFGIPEGMITGIIAGGYKALYKAVEFAEDNTKQGWLDLQKHQVSKKDVVIGIAASGTTPYVLAALRACKKKQIVTGSICCNKHAPISKIADYSIEAIVGPEFITGSTRMKSGTAQKMILNMISTSVMIQLGRVEDNKMTNMQLTNNKLVDRATKILTQKLGITDPEKIKKILKEKKSIAKVLQTYRSQK